MTPTATEPRRSRAVETGGVVANVALAAVILAVLALPNPLRVPDTVPHLRVVNETLYQVEVDVSSGRGEPWMALGAFRRETTRTVDEVLDQGERWTFRYSYGGVGAGEVILTRAQLEQEGWRLTITSDVGDRLRDAGLLPSAH